LSPVKKVLPEHGGYTRVRENVRVSLLHLPSAKGKPMGLSTIGAALSEDEGTIEDVLEPYLIANGYIERTARGRIATEKTYTLFRLSPPQAVPGGLFGEN